MHDRNESPSVVAAEPTAEILLATDFCEPARRALACAIQTARLRASPVRAVHVLDLTRSCRGEPISYSTAHTSAERRLRDIRRELRLAGIRESATLIDGGRPARAISEAATQCGSSLLVLGLNGAGRRRASTLGATSKALLTSAPCPVLTVSLSVSESATAHPWQNPLFVVDGHPESLHAVARAWPLPSPPAPLCVLAPAGSPVQLSSPLARSFTPIVLGVETAARKILHEIAHTRRDLLLLGFRSGGFLDSFSASSIAHAVVTQASCPVLTVRC